MIGVFDSGIGGLSVVKQIMSTLPDEDIIYFGDIARIPYGTKSVETINQFTSETVQFLLKKRVKALVVACNTISAVALDTVLKLANGIPVINVIDSGVQSVIETKFTQIGVIATPATIKSNAYANALTNQNHQMSVISKACPLFVPMIEEGLINNHPALISIANDYLELFKQNNIEALVLGCTHYPLIKNTLQQILGQKIYIIDPAIKTSLTLRDELSKYENLDKKTTPARYEFYITDNLERFKYLSELFLKTSLSNIQLVRL